MPNLSQKLTFIVMAITIVLLFQSPVIAVDKGSDFDWKLYKEKEGVKGYERNVKGSVYLQTRAETKIDAPMEVILEVLLDIPAFPKWMYACMEAIPIENKDLLTRILYFRQNAPWPTKDRDAIIKSVTTIDYDNPGSVTVSESIVNYNYKDAPEDTIRMVKFEGAFELRMVDRNTTLVRYTAFSEPGGFAPSGIAAGVMRKVSFNTTLNLIKMSKEKYYIEKAQTGEAKKEIEKALAAGKINFPGKLE